MSEVALYTLGMEGFAIEDITLTFFQMRGVVALIALANLPINAIAEATALRAMWNITNRASPSEITFALIWSNGKTIDTRRITNGF